MLESFTAAALRALERAEARARRRGSRHVEPIDLLAALADEPESRAALMMAEHGLEPSQVFTILDIAPWDREPVATESAAAPNDPGEAPSAVPPSPEVRMVLSDAALQARAHDRARAVGTEHLLAGLVAAPGPIAALLQQAGLRGQILLDQMRQAVTVETAPIPMADDFAPLDLSEPGEAFDLDRILDASANRAREGLRVVEDYVRFVLDDPMLTRRVKDTRHRLAEALRALDPERLLAARDTRGDVGTHIMTVTETVRENPRAVLTANFKRIAEALRSLEEYGKLINVWLAGRFEVLRYDIYTLEKLTLSAVAADRTLSEARLYVLVGGLPTLGDLTWIVGEALAGGAQVIQLREKGLPDRELLRRAAEVRTLTLQARAHFVLNDRPDLARIVGADGVHLGQDDLPVRQARRIVGPRALIGVSTHTPDQLEHALLEGASYLGVGPVFPSKTKAFDDGALAGLEFVRQAAAMTTRPWFAIGGISEANLDAVLAAGATRVAVCSEVVQAERTRAATAALRQRLDAQTSPP